MATKAQKVKRVGMQVARTTGTVAALAAVIAAAEATAREVAARKRQA